MSSNILEVLPSVHGVFIGVGTAFFSAFVLFAYQKLQESRDKLDKTLSEVESFSTPNNFIGGDLEAILTDDKLDWDNKAKYLIHSAKSTFSHLDYEAKYGIKTNGLASNYTDEQILSATKNLCCMFHFLFTTYPFSGKSMVSIDGVSCNGEVEKKKPFSSDRLNEIEARISYLSWCWDTSNLSLVALGEKATEIENMRNDQKAEKSFNETVGCIEHIQEHDKQRLWEKHKPRPSLNYAEVIIDYFNKISLYRNKVLPQLSSTMSVYETFNNRFKLRLLTLTALKVLAFVFLFGVFAPISLLSFQQDYGLKWCSFLPYFLLAITFLPYVYIWAVVFKKVKRMEHQ